MGQSQEILNKSVLEGLKEFGQPVMKTIVWHLNAHGIFLDSDNEVDIRTLYGHLEQIVGNAADLAIEAIYESLRASEKTLPPINSNDSLELVLNNIEQLVVAGSDDGRTKGGSF